MDTVHGTNAGGQLLLADSFRVAVRDGVPSVRGLARHLARFTTSSIRLGVLPTDRLSFVGRARGEIAAFGAGFPRLEVRTDQGGSGSGSGSGSGPGSGSASSGGADRPVFTLLLRELPALETTIELRSVTLEAGQLAAFKGPMIAEYGELNRALGAEALLCDADGVAREGATTAVLAWDGDVLVRSSSLHRVISVTEALVLNAAAAHRRPIVAAPLTPELLRRSELWAVNALHGIRPVRLLDGHERPPADPDRLAAFRGELDQLWEPVRIH